ncbi:MAG: FAD-binding oxidoreductase, partial [Proteobacteria bacterium]|nr:FAD-binding oxidoreductase [Pseudomonadota bacterium]
MTDLSALQRELGAIETIDDPALRRQRSRDFYWYSPILKRQLDAALADLVVVAKSEDEIVATLAACHARRVPVTVRG